MSAATEYQRLRQECQKEIERLAAALGAHAERQAAKPEYWTYPGDLKHVRVELLRLSAHLGDEQAREILLAEGVDR